MKELYTKSVEVYPGDTLVHANGERWVVPDNVFRHILVEEDTVIEHTGEDYPRDFADIRNRVRLGNR